MRWSCPERSRRLARLPRSSSALFVAPLPWKRAAMWRQTTPPAPRSRPPSPATCAASRNSCLSFWLRRFFLDAPDFLEALPDARLETLVRRHVVAPPRERFRQARHVGHFLLGVMCILVAFSVSNVAHEFCSRVSQMQRHGFGHRRLKILLHFAERFVHGV